MILAALLLAGACSRSVEFRLYCMTLVAGFVLAMLFSFAYFLSYV